MATNKIKFKMSIEKVTVEFEGDYEHGRALQQGINRTVSGLADLQNRAMGMEDQNPNPKLIEQTKTSDSAPPGRRRRGGGRRKSAAANGDGSTPETEASGDSEANGDTERRSSGVSPTGLLVELRKGGFFSEKARTSGDVLAELHRKGYSMLRANDLTYALRALTQKDVLRRDHDDQQNQWVYAAGTHDEPK